MMQARYPKAIWLGDGKSGGTYLGGPWKVVLHTSETGWVPGYRGGYTAPHITYDPEWRKFYQHTSLLVAARSLRNEAGGAQTNRDQAIQLEIVCYSNKAVADGASYRQWVGDLTSAQLADIHEFIVWCAQEFGVAMVWPGKQAYSWAEANADGFRMSTNEWDDWDGVCAHQHVPEGNTHWDTGALNWNAVIYGIEEDEMQLRKGDGGFLVALAQLRYAQKGYDIGTWAPYDGNDIPDWFTEEFVPGADGDFGGTSERITKEFQADIGAPITGIIDSFTFAVLDGGGGTGPKGEDGEDGQDGVGIKGDPGLKGDPGEGISSGDQLTVTVV